MPTVSVITPAYNAEKTLQQSAESVLNQGYTDLELIIIVNGCTDRTMEVSQIIASSDPRVRIIESPKGKVPARNRGFEAARGSVIALNDADDVWLPDKLLSQLAVMSNGADIVGGRIECVDESGQVSTDPLARPLGHVGIVNSLLNGVNPIANSAAIFKRGLLDYTGTYDDCFPFCEDYHFWLKAAKFGRFENVDKTVIRYFTHHSPGYDHNIPKALAAFYKSLYTYTGVVIS
jgi:glycosyltransferase involved in cell wall biosynthesis